MQLRTLESIFIFVQAEDIKAREKGVAIDPLEFYHLHAEKIPILGRIAAQVLAADATSGDPERFGSRATIYYTPLRNRLSPETAKKMVEFLHGSYSAGTLTRRMAVSKTNVEQFIARQSFDCIDNYSHLTEDGIKYLNSLCSWVSYEGSDDDEQEEGEEEEY